VLHAPLYECATCLEVDGVLAGSLAEARAGATLLGQASGYGGAVEVGLSPALASGQSISARQVHCGTPSQPSPAVPVTDVRKGREKKLPVLELAAPVYACQQYVSASGCTPGALVTLLANGVPITKACAGSTSATLWAPGPGFSEGASLTATQELCGTAGDPTPAVTVLRAADIPRPALRGPLYAGDTAVTTAMTVAGEVVEIRADGNTIGAGGAGGGDAALNVDPPLVAGQHVTALVSLCDEKKESLPLIVGSRPDRVPPPAIEPLFACATAVPVTGCLPGSRLRVFGSAGGATVLMGTARTFASGAVVGVVGLLQAGWRITATQEVGGTESLPSPAVTVEPGPSPKKPRIRQPLYPCAACVQVLEVLPGARVDVYGDGLWIGGADASGKSADVGVHPGLRPGSSITAVQTVCGKISGAASAKAESKDPKLPPPEIRPAFAGDSYVTVEGLVPGAVVEVEETSVYGLVIGSACAGSPGASVSLSVPLFAGAVLRARQRLCEPSRPSPEVKVSEPKAWPLGAGQYSAGSLKVTDVPISDQVQWQQGQTGGVSFVRPAKNAAMLFYPATADGNATPVAAGGPFPVIVYGHAKRFPQALLPDEAPCPGAPADTTHEYERVTGILSQLARWGFIGIAPDLSWLTTAGVSDWTQVLQDALDYMAARNGESSSRFHNQVTTAGPGAIGHSTSGYAASQLATRPGATVAALALIAPAAGSSPLNFLANLGPRPLLVFEGGEDVGHYGRSGDFYGAAAPPKVLVSIPGANHFGYYDDVCVLADNTATISQADQQRIAAAYLVAFFRRRLQGAAEEEDYLDGVRPVEELEGFGITVTYM
jgi:pimeloyl-ACP methyl ester carboxylesterase